MAEKSLREKHKELVEHLHEGVKENFLKDGSLAPVTFMITYDNKILIIGGAVNVSNDKEKDRYAEMIRMTSRKLKAVGTIFATESWTAKAVKDEKEIDDIYKRYGGLQNYPNKIEAVTIIEEYLDAKYLTSYEIIRNGNKISLKDAETIKMDGMGGRMSNLINKPKIDEMLQGLDIT